MSEAVHHTLKFPIEMHDGDGNVTQRITSVTLHRVKGRDLDGLDKAKGGMSRTKALIAACCKLLPAHVEEMDFADIVDVGDKVTDFLGLSPPTGEM